MQDHELISQDDPQCLYCGTSCEIHLEGGVGYPTYNVDTLSCIKCKETFEIHWTEDNQGMTVVAFLFSCKDIYVFRSYDKPETLFVGGEGLIFGNNKYYSGQYPASEEAVSIAAFKIDFSDKKKLHKKLKTYIVFS